MKNKINLEKIRHAADLIRSAEAIWVGTGAGITSAAGPQFDYGNTEWFKKEYPALVKMGYSKKIDLMGGFWLPPEIQWGFYAKNVMEVRYSSPGQEIYTKLLEILNLKKDYFIITTNVDNLFVRNGFPKDRIYTPQGDYAKMQCMTPCTQEIWDTKPIIKKIIAATDPDTQRAAPHTVPKCPNCGGKVFLNARGGDWFIHKPYEKQAAAYQQWLKKASKKKVVALDIGSGFNTPVWVRWPAEKITEQFPSANLIRINPGHPEVPKEIEGKAISFANDALEVISRIWEEMVK